MIRQANLPAGAINSDGFAAMNRGGNSSIQFDDERSSSNDVYNLQRQGVYSPNLQQQNYAPDFSPLGGI